VSCERFTAFIRKRLWECAVRNYGPDHKVARKFFGRYVGAMGGTLSPVSSGPEAWVACRRELGHTGFRNRAWRKHMERSVTPQ
jgi:hypothetical protein